MTVGKGISTVKKMRFTHALKSIRTNIEVFIQRHPLWFAVCVLVLLWAVTLWAPVVKQEEFLAPQNDDTITFFGGKKSVGQSFIAPYGLSRISIPIRLNINTENQGPLLLHLRKTYFGEDIRTSTLFRTSEDVATFSFRPIRGHAGQQLIWVLEAPYHGEDVFSVYREKDDTAFLDQDAYLAGKYLKGNFGFTLTSSRPYIMTLFSSEKQSESDVFSFSDVSQWEWNAVMLGLLLAGALIIIWQYRPSLTSQSIPWIIGMLLVATAIVHGFFAVQLPLINDEGAYLQDALQTTWNFLPVVDFLTKGIVYIWFLKLWQAVVPTHVLWLRGFSLLSWVTSVYLTVRIARYLGFSQFQQLCAGALLALTPAAIALTTPLLLQVTSVPTVLVGIVVAFLATRRNSLPLAALAAIIIVVAFFIRSSSIVGGVVGALILVVYAQEKWRLKLVGTYVAVGLLLAVGIGLISWQFIGIEKTAVIFSVEALGISEQRSSSSGESAMSTDSVIRQLTETTSILWQSGPWLLLGVIMTLIFLVPRRQIWVSLIGFSLIVIVWMRFYHHLVDMGFLLPATIPLKEWELWASFWIVLPLLIGMRVLHTVPGKPSAFWERKWSVVISIWLVLLIILYSHWGRFRHSYLVEFLPPLALFVGWGLEPLTVLLRQVVSPGKYLRFITVCIIMCVIGVSYVLNWAVAWKYPHTGTMDPRSIEQMATILHREMPKDEMLFTAQPVITAFAKQPIIFGYSHPGWYRDHYLGNVATELWQLYFMPDEKLTEYLRTDAQFVLTERRTNEIYFEFYPERQAILKDKFTQIAEVIDEATNEPMRLYRRK